MKITIERQQGSTGENAWKAVLEVLERGCRVEMVAFGETTSKARANLRSLFYGMYKEIGVLLEEG